jgi:hypothetical protein
MSVDRGLLNWGIFLVLLGGVPLAVGQGWISADLVEHAWELWPLLLVGAGVGLILRATPLRALGGIVVSATFGVILGSFIAVGFGGFSFGSLGCGDADPGAPQLVERSGSFSGSDATVQLVANCARVAVSTTPDASWNVDVRGTENARPAIVESADKLVVRAPEGPTAFPVSTRRASWAVSIGTDPRLTLGLEVNGGGADVNLDGATLTRLTVDGNAIGDSRLDLESAFVERLDVSVNAASIAILLPASANTKGRIEGNAASVELCAPAGVGLRLLVDDNITASNNYDTVGLVQRGSAWETPGFASAATQIELATVGSAVSYDLNPEDGCR